MQTTGFEGGSPDLGASYNAMSKAEIRNMDEAEKQYVIIFPSNHDYYCFSKNHVLFHYFRDAKESLELSNDVLRQKILELHELFLKYIF